MTSQIVSETIDGAYPVAGIDNDTQGFRDNFSIIKSNFAIAQGEISQLQENTAKLNESNDFNGTNIADANLQYCTEQYHNAGTIIAGQNVSYLNGNYQTIRLNIPISTSSVTLNLSDWPESENDNRYAVMRIELFGNDTPKTVNWTIEGGGTLKKDPNWPGTFTVDSSTNPIIVEFWTYNAGNTVLGKYLGQFT